MSTQKNEATKEMNATKEISTDRLARIGEEKHDVVRVDELLELRHRVAHLGERGAPCGGERMARHWNGEHDALRGHARLNAPQRGGGGDRFKLRSAPPLVRLQRASSRALSGCGRSPRRRPERGARVEAIGKLEQRLPGRKYVGGSESNCEQDSREM